MMIMMIMHLDYTVQCVYYGCFYSCCYTLIVSNYYVRNVKVLAAFLYGRDCTFLFNAYLF